MAGNLCKHGRLGVQITIIHQQALARFKPLMWIANYIPKSNPEIHKTLCWCVCRALFGIRILGECESRLKGICKRCNCSLAQRLVRTCMWMDSCALFENSVRLPALYVCACPVGRPICWRSVDPIIHSTEVMCACVKGFSSIKVFGGSESQMRVTCVWCIDSHA